MTWHNSISPHALSEINNDGFNRDFQLFSYQNPHPFKPSCPLTQRSTTQGSHEHRQCLSNTIAAPTYETHWDGSYDSGVEESIASEPGVPISGSTAKLSGSDSGYGSTECSRSNIIYQSSERYVDTAINNAAHLDPGVCEFCFRDSDKKRYFNNNAERRKHMLSHTKPFKCGLPACSNRTGFSSSHDLARHEKSCHNVLTTDTKTSKFYYRCAAPSCRNKSKHWPRKDNFKAHLEGTHKYDHAMVAEMIEKSQYSPDSLASPKASNPQSKPTRKKRRTAIAQKDESSDGSRPELICHNEPVKQDEEASAGMLLTQPLHASCSHGSSMSDVGIPQISVSDATTLGSCPTGLSPYSSTEMMDVDITPTECIDSPYVLLQPPPSIQYGDISRLTIPRTPSTDPESSFESDFDDFTTDSEFDGELYNTYTPFQPFLHAAAQRLLTIYMGVRQRPTNVDANSQPRSNQASSSGTQSHTHQPGRNSSTMPYGSRKRSRNTNEDEDEDEKDEKKLNRRSRATSTDEEPLFACPFNKRDPITYERCYVRSLKSMSRVKQHLDRAHRVPIHCPRCYNKFSDEARRDLHVREGICSTKSEQRLEGISNVQWDRIRLRNRGMTSEEIWYSIFETLFPGVPRPVSPYIDASLSAELSAFRDFTAQAGRDIVNTVIRDHLLNQPLLYNQQAELEDFTRQVFQLSTERLFQGWQARPRSTTALLSPRYNTPRSLGPAPGVGMPPLTPPLSRTFEPSENPLSFTTEDTSFVQENDANRNDPGQLMFGEILAPPALYLGDEDFLSDVGSWSRGYGDRGENEGDDFGMMSEGYSI